MIKIIFLSITFFSITFLSAPLKAGKENKIEEMMNAAGPVIKQMGAYVDSEVIDMATLTYCTLTGAKLGHAFSISLWQKYYGYYGMSFYPDTRLEDDLGYYVGIVVGHHVGKIVVKGRHNITDRVFPALANLSSAALQAGLIWCDQTTKGMGSYIELQLEAVKNNMLAYATQNQGAK